MRVGGHGCLLEVGVVFSLGVTPREEWPGHVVVAVLIFLGISTLFFIMVATVDIQLCTRDWTYFVHQ